MVLVTAGTRTPRPLWPSPPSMALAISLPLALTLPLALALTVGGLPLAKRLLHSTSIWSWRPVGTMTKQAFWVPVAEAIILMATSITWEWSRRPGVAVSIPLKDVTSILISVAWSRQWQLPSCQ